MPMDESFLEITTLDESNTDEYRHRQSVSYPERTVAWGHINALGN